MFSHLLVELVNGAKFRAQAAKEMATNRCASVRSSGRVDAHNAAQTEFGMDFKLLTELQNHCSRVSHANLFCFIVSRQYKYRSIIGPSDAHLLPHRTSCARRIIECREKNRKKELKNDAEHLRTVIAWQSSCTKAVRFIIYEFHENIRAAVVARVCESASESFENVKAMRFLWIHSICLFFFFRTQFCCLPTNEHISLMADFLFEFQLRLTSKLSEKKIIHFSRKCVCSDVRNREKLSKPHPYRLRIFINAEQQSAMSSRLTNRLKTMKNQQIHIQRAVEPITLNKYLPLRPNLRSVI